eukprot:SM000185S04037  [mRNA]  locus=s185:146626:148913:+ [translate_table: standard]
MGGAFFLPAGVGTALLAMGTAAPELQAVAAVTAAFAAIGLLDDALVLIGRHNRGLPGRTKLLLQLAVGLGFYWWLDRTVLLSPYKMRWLIPLPQPLGLWYAGKWCLPLSVFTYAAMSNGVNLTDGADGLAAGVAAAAFFGMTVAVLPIYPALAVFGASMAGACVGFLAHNRHKAAVFMGDTGSLALGGALAAMAVCTGLYLPLLVASGIFVIETLSVVGQVAYFKWTRRRYGEGRRWLRMAPLHHHLELSGLPEPRIVASAYMTGLALALAAAHLALISV